MLLSKIKPCMCKCKPNINGETAEGSLYQSWFNGLYPVTWITAEILELIHANGVLTGDGRNAFIRSKPIGGFGLRVFGDSE